MTHRRTLSVLLVSLMAIIGAIAMLAILSTPNNVAAQRDAATPTTTSAESSSETSSQSQQSSDAIWLSSAEPPPGTSIESLSLPDASPTNVESSSETSSQGQQTAGSLWLSSAEPPPGTSIESLSAPDVGPSTPREAEETAALISWRVTGSAFKPRENDVSYAVNGNGSCTYVTAGSAFTVWNIPVVLPQGSHIDTLRMYYYDTNASNTTAWFTIYDLYGSIVNEWSVSSSTNAGNSFNDSVQISHTLDYSVYSYMINWRPVVVGSTIQLCGFRIFYTPPPFGLNFLPLTTK